VSEVGGEFAGGNDSTNGGGGPERVKEAIEFAKEAENQIRAYLLEARNLLRAMKLAQDSSFLERAKEAERKVLAGDTSDL
jgi:hypothetical protein